MSIRPSASSPGARASASSCRLSIVSDRRSSVVSDITFLAGALDPPPFLLVSIRGLAATICDFLRGDKGACSLGQLNQEVRKWRDEDGADGKAVLPMVRVETEGWGKTVNRSWGAVGPPTGWSTARELLRGAMQRIDFGKLKELVILVNCEWRDDPEDPGADYPVDPVSDDGVLELAKVLAATPQLDVLHLSLTTLRSTGRLARFGQKHRSLVLSASVRELARNFPTTLRDLELWWDLRQASGWDRHLIEMATFLPRGLKHLVIGFECYCGITDDSMERLARSMPRELVSLRIYARGNRITDRGIKAIGKSLPRTLLSLDLCFAANMIDVDVQRGLIQTPTNEGLFVLARNMRPRLQELALSFMYTDDLGEGFRKVAIHLPLTLRVLTIYSNFGYQGPGVVEPGFDLASVADSLPLGLTELLISMNATNIAPGGVVALANKIPELTRLRKLRLDFDMRRGIPIDQAERVALESSLEWSAPGLVDHMVCWPDEDET